MAATIASFFLPPSAPLTYKQRRPHYHHVAQSSPTPPESFILRNILYLPISSMRVVFTPHPWWDRSMTTPPLTCCRLRCPVRSNGGTHLRLLLRGLSAGQLRHLDLSHSSNHPHPTISGTVQLCWMVQEMLVCDCWRRPRLWFVVASAAAVRR